MHIYCPIRHFEEDFVTERDTFRLGGNCYADCGDPVKPRVRESTMLTVMCPNCRHRFPAPGCCEPSIKASRKVIEQEKAGNNIHPTCYVGGLLVPRGYTSGGGCFINTPAVLHGPVISQSDVAHCGSTVGIANCEMINDYDYDITEFSNNIKASLVEHNRHSTLRSRADLLNDLTSLSPIIMENADYGITSSEHHVASTCEHDGGNITIATPRIQSGGCLIQSTETGILVQAPHIEIRPKHTGGGCLVQKRLSTEDEQLMTSNTALIDNNVQRTLVGPPSGCSELPGNRSLFSFRATTDNSETIDNELRRMIPIKKNNCCCCNGAIQNLCQSHSRSSNALPADDARDSLLLESAGNGMQIQVNATLQLPANLGQCKMNITAIAATPSSNQAVAMEPRSKNNFNGGGIVQPDNNSDCTAMNRIVTVGNGCNSNERRDGAPTTPVSWLMPCPWNLDSSYLTPTWTDKDVNRLSDVKRLLQMCGWYHKGISWQQSENLLRDAPVGRWLMRNSSDSRYTFAVSVQTARGPTSVRVHYFYERFRLDAEPRLALTMPYFDCPIKMLEYYVEYSKRMDEHRKEVWVDYSGQMYSQIYLTKPLVKEVRSLSHQARLVINRNKLPTEHLPLLLKNYLAEYPYTL